jgi:hypothetical protein
MFVDRPFRNTSGFNDKELNVKNRGRIKSDAGKPEKDSCMPGVESTTIWSYETGFFTSQLP